MRAVHAEVLLPPVTQPGDKAALFGNVTRLVEAINARPAAGRADKLKERVSLKQDMDAEARAAMFRHLAA